jgi:hypothetical protein
VTSKKKNSKYLKEKCNLVNIRVSTPGRGRNISLPPPYEKIILKWM